mgnify:CR=1 FL=1
MIPTRTISVGGKDYKVKLSMRFRLIQERLRGEEPADSITAFVKTAWALLMASNEDCPDFEAFLDLLDDDTDALSRLAEVINELSRFEPVSEEPQSDSKKK